MSLPDIDAYIDIAAPPSRVWHVLTNAGLVGEWLGCVGFEPVIGNLFFMQPNAERRAANDMTGATHCEVEAVEAPHLLRFSWFLPGYPKTYVELVVESQAANRCRVRLQHTGWNQFKPEDVQAIYDGLSGGWKSYVLPSLKRVAEASSA